MAAHTKWRTRCLGAVLFAIFIQVVNGYEETYLISQLSPKSAINSQLPQGVVLQTSETENLDIQIEPSSKYDENISDNEETHPQDIIYDEEKENLIRVARSADPNRESRSINIDDLPISNNNAIDNEIELHNKRKYYDIQPTKPLDYLRTKDDEILTSEGFGDRLDFRFPGEDNRVPKARALTLGPIRPTAVQPTLATTYKDQARQNSEIQNIITGIVKLLNGNVNVQANSQLLNGRPGRPMNSRINNRGPPRIADVPPIPEFDKPVTPPVHAYHPTKTPPPYPFDRPPHLGVNLPEQIVPPISLRPGFHRPPIPPWTRRPPQRPLPSRRPPNLPMYKPMPSLPADIPDIPDEKPDEEITEIETNNENNIHHNEKETTTIKNVETTTVQESNSSNETEEQTTVEITTSTESTTTSSTTTTTTTTTTTEKPTTTEKLTTEAEPITTTEKPTTTEKVKVEKNKKKDEKDKLNKFKPVEQKNETATEFFIEPSIPETKTASIFSIATPTPTAGLVLLPSIIESSTDPIKTSSINTQPLPTTQLPHPYRPRPGIVLDDPEFKPNRQPPITPTRHGEPGRYGEIFDVTVSAIQGPGGKGEVHIESVNPDHLEDDIIVSPSGQQGFVSIDGKRTYLNLFDSATVSPSKVQSVPQVHTSSPLGTGVAIPTDDVPRRPTPSPGHHHRPGYRRPQPTVRIDTCIVGDDSTCDIAQNEKCRTEAGISSCQCRPGYARRTHRDPCRRIVSLVLDLRVDRLYDRKVAWDHKLSDKDSEPYQQLSYEAIRAIDSAFSMTPFSDDFVSGTVNSVHNGDQNERGVFINYTVLMQETPETLRSGIATDIQKHLLGVIRRRSNNVGASALWVDTPAGSVRQPTDLDECASSDLNDCHQLATCTNTWGGFKCSCPDTTLDAAPSPHRAGRDCRACAASHCNERGVCKYSNNQPYCSCNSGYYGSTCEVDGEVVGVAVGASLAAALVIALTLAALLSWSRKWSREQKAVGMGSPVFNYMAANTIKTPPVGQPPYQVTLEERMRWAQIAEAMAQANHYAQPEPIQTMSTRPSSAMFGGYPTLPPVPMPRMGLHGHHNGTLNTVASRANTAASHHNLYGYTNHMATESTSSEASSHVQERADLLVPRPKSRARSMHNQTGIYYDVEYENAPEGIYGTKGIPLSTYTVSRGPPFYRT